MNKFAGFFAAYNASLKAGNTQTKEELIQEFTEGRTASLRELTVAEYAELVTSLNRLIGAVQTDKKGDNMRKAIISIFHKMGRPVADAIAWAEKQGVKGQKRAFNEYTNAELYALIIVAEKVLKDWQIAIRKNISKLQ